MRREQFDEATEILNRISHIEEILITLRGHELTPPPTRMSGFVITTSRSETYLNNGEILVMITAFESELKRLRAEFDRL